MAITLRPATIDDLVLLEYWDQQDHVIASDPDSDWEWKQNLRYPPLGCEQIIAELAIKSTNTQPCSESSLASSEEKKAIGFVQIIDPVIEKYHYWGEYLAQHNPASNKPGLLRAIDIWIGDSQNLNRGYGSEMMKQAIAKCFSQSSVTAILIDPLKSNTDAHRFYQRFGFKVICEFDFDGDHCLVFQLPRIDWRPD